MGKKIIYYKDIFRKDFLSYFDEYQEAIGNIKLNELNIDLHKIAKVIGVEIKTSNQNNQYDQYNNKKREIYIDTSQPKQLQNITIAYKLGHFVLNHDNLSDELRYSNEYSFADSIRDRASNRFATLLLMPKELLALGIEQYQKEHGMTDQELENSSANMLVKKLAKQLNVPEQNMKWRLITLGVIE